MRQEIINLYTASELADEHPGAFSKARESFRESFAQDSFCTDCTDGFEQIAHHMGININRGEIYFDTYRGHVGFGGDYEHRPTMLKDLPVDHELQRIAQLLLAAQAKMPQPSLVATMHLSYRGKMTVDVYDTLNVCGEEYLDALAMATDDIQEAIDDLCHWLLCRLREEEEWVSSEDYFIDAAQANGWLFTESGEIVAINEWQLDNAA